VPALEKQIGKNSGFKNIYHELEFFGQCPECAAAQA
jgi:Fur family transcriptional regulator, ferric uptake regulator